MDPNELREWMMTISTKIDNIALRITSLENSMDYIKRSSNHMDEHINFVEQVYDTVKSPMTLLLNTFPSGSYLTNTERTSSLANIR